MKQLTTYNRAAGYLNKIFDLLNDEYFENTLSKPTITIQSTPKAYGHFTQKDDTWISAIGSMNEINIGAGTLARPIENVVCTLLHEMVHYYNHVNGVQDCSRGGTYHNKRFKGEAEARGMIVTKSEKYGYAHTEPGEQLLDFVLKNDLTDILLTRNEQPAFTVRPGTGSSETGSAFTGTQVKRSSTRKLLCPCCGNSVRATKTVRIMCMDCMQQMIEV